MKTILLCLTGGTLGASFHQGQIAPDAKAQATLLSQFHDLNREHTQVTFEVIQPFNLLSENMMPRLWGELIQALTAQDLQRYDGIIVGHGTDTLPYTAAALSYALRGLPIPVLLVSSHLPLDEPQANGLANFSAAVDFIIQHPLSGVYVPYQNPGQKLALHAGLNLLSSLPLSCDFISAAGQPLAWYERGQFHFNDAIHTESSEQEWQIPARFSSRILLLRPYPGLDYRGINLTGYQAVLHDLYHSGTACIASEPGATYALPDFMARCQAANLPVYLAPIASDQRFYQTSLALDEAGGRFLPDITLEAAYVKLCLAYGVFADTDDIHAFLSL
ncbi:MAG: asparaginase domain-containing protein [Methylococcales bacterium]|nr:asparaginase domain-containing protein [Methylococcales bacterium]